MFSKRIIASIVIWHRFSKTKQLQLRLSVHRGRPRGVQFCRRMADAHTQDTGSTMSKTKNSFSFDKKVKSYQQNR